MGRSQPRGAYHRASSDDPHLMPAPNMRERYKSPDTVSMSPLRDYDHHYPVHSTHEDQPRLLQPSTASEWLSGWRVGTYTASGVTLLSFVINPSTGIWLRRRSNPDSTLVEVSHGSCDTVSRMDTWIHLLIDLISTLLLRGSNYCMQCLCVPTRSEVDKAHAAGRRLNIGLQSFINLRNAGWKRLTLWWLLASSSFLYI